MAPAKDPYLEVLERLERTVAALTAQVQAHDKKLRWIASAAIFVVGVVGGPNAAHVLAVASSGG